jgi:hypothetical protein
MPPLTYQQQKARIEALLARIKARLPELEAALQELAADEEDGVYRFFHGSFKVFHLQKPVRAAHQLITEIRGELDPPFAYFEEVVKAGTEGTFDGARTNAHWEAETEPIPQGAVVHEILSDPNGAPRQHLGFSAAGHAVRLGRRALPVRPAVVNSMPVPPTVLPGARVRDEPDHARRPPP